MTRIFKKKSQTETKHEEKPLDVFVYNVVMDRLRTPSELHLYQVLERSAPEYELRRLLGAFKVPYVSYLLRKIWDKRYVCICADAESARMLLCNAMIGGACSLGENSEVDEENINRFNQGDVDHLFITPQTGIPELYDVEAVVFAQPSVEDEAIVNALRPAMVCECPKLYFFIHHDSIDEVLKENVLGMSPTVTETDFPYHLLTGQKSWTATSFTPNKARSSVPFSTSTQRRNTAMTARIETSSKSRKRASIVRGS
jgi:hypothetical protein